MARVEAEGGKKFYIQFMAGGSWRSGRDRAGGRSGVAADRAAPRDGDTRMTRTIMTYIAPLGSRREHIDL